MTLQGLYIIAKIWFDHFNTHKIPQVWFVIEVFENLTPPKNMGVEAKIGSFSPKMDGL